VSAGRSLDQLRIGADTIASAPDTAFQYATDAKLPSHLPNINGLAPGPECHDGKLREPRELGDDVFGNAVAKILLFTKSSSIAIAYRSTSPTTT